MSAITAISAREILDSRGCPTVWVEVRLSSGASGKASVPSGISRGAFEARQLFDGDPYRYRGAGVLHACNKIENEISYAIIGMDAFDQARVDDVMTELDGTSDMHRLGGNAIFAVSIAVARAAANEAKLPLFRYIGGMFANVMPQPMFDIVNGGRDSASPLAFQEFLVHFPGFGSCTGALAAAVELRKILAEAMKNKNIHSGIGLKGGFSPEISSEEKVLDLLLQASEKAGLAPIRDVKFGIDCGANAFFREGVYDYRIFSEKGIVRSPDSQLEYIRKMVSSFPIDYIEDPFAGSDQQSFVALSAILPKDILLCGDDLYCGNSRRISAGSRCKMTNCVMLKPGQSATLSSALAAADAARRGDQMLIAGCRSGETEDCFVADFAVAIRAGRIKCGAPCAMEHIAKYNRLSELEKIV